MNSSLYFCFCAGNAMPHSPDSVKKVTVKVFGYMKMGAKCIKAGGNETLKFTNTQENKQWEQDENESLEKIEFNNEKLYVVLHKGVHGSRQDLYEHHDWAAFQGACPGQIHVASCRKSTGMLIFWFFPFKYT